MLGVRTASSDHMNPNFRTPFLASMRGTDLWLLAKQETGDPASPPDQDDPSIDPRSIDPSRAACW